MALKSDVGKGKASCSYSAMYVTVQCPCGAVKRGIASMGYMEERSFIQCSACEAIYVIQVNITVERE